MDRANQLTTTAWNKSVAGSQPGRLKFASEPANDEMRRTLRQRFVGGKTTGLTSFEQNAFSDTTNTLIIMVNDRQPHC
jgi:hypothetical protein